MTGLYLVINGEGTYLVNITRDNAIEMERKNGWEVYRLGTSRLQVMPGVLAEIDQMDSRFMQNLNRLRQES